MKSFSQFFKDNYLLTESRMRFDRLFLQPYLRRDPKAMPSRKLLAEAAASIDLKRIVCESDDE